MRLKTIPQTPVQNFLKINITIKEYHGNKYFYDFCTL